MAEPKPKRKPNARKPEIVLAALEERMLPIAPESQSLRVAELLDELKRSLNRTSASDKGETETEA
jgi:hypothetical protein